MSPVLVGVVAFLAAALPASENGYWLQAVPAGPEEAALREAVTKNGFSGPIEALRQVSASYPGTAASGLAQLVAGLALAEAGRTAEAATCLTHADVARTVLADYAQLGLGRAWEEGEPAKAAAAYLAAAGSDALACPALLRAAEAYAKAEQPDLAVEALDRVLARCPGQEARALQRLGEIQDARGDGKAAAAAYDRLDRDYPASPQAQETAARLGALAGLLPPVPPAERAARELPKALALFDAGRYRDALLALRLVQSHKPVGDDADLVRVRSGRSLLALSRLHEAENALASVGAKSPYGAEAAYHLAKSQVRRGRSPSAYENVARAFPGTPWGEEALLALANHYQKDARDEEALPYYRRLLQEYPEGRYVERAVWRLAWADFRAGRYEDAAQRLERTVRSRAPGTATPVLLYWAGRARAALGEIDRARPLLEETVRRFKHTYHGQRARDALARLPATPLGVSGLPALLAPASTPWAGIPQPQQTRIRQLLLIERLEEAADELRALPPSPLVQGTLAWIEWRRGRLRNAIVAMKKAYPDYVGEGGDRLPDELWRILFPLQYEETLREKAEREGLEPALVAAIICQESTFDAGAISRAGARGLMQVIPATGAKVARDLGVRFRKLALHNPETSLNFGTRYLHRLMERYDGHVERALAAYNAGPHRVDAWTAGRPDMPAEEFIESIPFTETRYYVMIVLASREEYRRLYGLARVPPAPASGGGRP